MFTLEDVECIAACTEAPCLQVNYRYCYEVTHDEFDQLVDDLRSGRLDDEIPPHGTLARVRQRIPADRAAGAVAPDDVTDAPVWMPAPARRDVNRHDLPQRGRLRRPADAPEDRHRRASATTTPTPSSGYLATGGYDGLRRRARQDARRRCTTR